MNRDNLKSIVNILGQIEQVNLGERIAAHYKDKDLSSILLQEIT